jgi:hypothetical protein
MATNNSTPITYGIQLIRNAFATTDYADSGGCIAASKMGFNKDEDNPNRLAPLVWVDVFGGFTRDQVQVQQLGVGKVIRATVQFWVMAQSDFTKATASRLAEQDSPGQTWGLNALKDVLDQLEIGIQTDAMYLHAGSLPFTLAYEPVFNAFDANYDGYRCSLEITLFDSGNQQLC